MKLTLLLLQLFCVIVLATAQHDSESICYLKDFSGRSRDHNADFEKMILEVSFFPEEGLVMGNVKYDFQPIQKQVDTLFFDAVNIDIKSAKLDGKKLSFKSTEKGVTVYFEQPLHWNNRHKIEFDYEATPRKGIYFIGWNDPTNRSRKQIWTQGQGIDNRHWIPSYDFQNDKLLTETIIHFSRKYEVISNGNLMGVEDRHDGSLSWHYKMTKPHASYLVMLAIGQYDYKELSGKNGVPIRQYFYPDLPNTFEPTYQHSVKMMDWLEAEFGVPYPWETYANVPVQDFIYGAMENTTATIFTDYYVQDERAALERNYVGTNAHELVHQWFGDYITAWSGHDHWLQESFATHYAKQFRRFVDGEDTYQEIRRREMQSARSANKKNQIPVVHSKAGSARHYPKGSFVIDMLKYVVGKEQYDKVLKWFLVENAYANVDTRDFQMAFLEVLGMNLDWFFDQWLYRGGEPHYEITKEVKKDKTTIYVAQTHEVSDLVGYFKMPVTFEIYYEDGSKSAEKHWVNGQIDTIVILNPDRRKVKFIVFDPNNEILKNIEYPDKNTKEWTAQARQAENMIDRYEALIKLRSIEEKGKRDDLIKIYDAENYYLSKAEVIRQLANDDHAKSMNLVKRALHDDHVKVRRAALEHADKIFKELLPDYEKLLTDRSYVNIEKSLRKLSEQFPEEKKKYLLITAEEKGKDMNVRITWLELSSEGDDQTHLSELIDYSSNSYGFRTRINSMKALQSLNYFNAEVFDNIVDGMLCTNKRLVGPSKKAMKHFYSAEAHTTTIEQFYDSRKWEDWELEIVEKVFQPQSTNTN